MEQQRKTIQINPNFFNIGKKTKKKQKKSHRDRLSKTIKPNNLKKQLLAKIKSHQMYHKEQSVEKKDIDEFQTDFNSSLNYLQTMIKQKKEKKIHRHKRTKKHKTNNSPQYTIPIVNTQPFSQNDNNNNMPPQLTNSSNLKPSSSPPYGCLKNGNKPTYSQYIKTLKKPNYIKKPNLTLPPRAPPSQEIINRKEKLNKLRENMVTPKKNPISNIINKKRTIKIFKLGKKNGKIGVLIKSGKTRKKLKEEQKILHMKAISDVKQYLRKHNLIKAGTSAPENVLRKLYEDSFLSGDIYNNNADVLLHNYIQDDNL